MREWRFSARVIEWRGPAPLYYTPLPAEVAAEIERVKKQATHGLYWATALSGYGFALALLGVAIYKPLRPESLGLWANESGGLAVLGHFAQSPPGMREVLGWWIVPIAIVLSVAAFHLTRRLLAALKPLL